MRIASLTAAIALCALAGAAAAQPGTMTNPPTETTICLDVSGQSLPAVCRASASRLDQREDICTCHEGTPVTAPICAPGVRPPAESAAFERVRRDAARDGTLVGDSYEGKPMCRAARNSGR